MLNAGGGLFNQQTPGAGLLFNAGANQLGAAGGNQLGGGLFNSSASASSGLFATQTPQNQQQPGKMFNLGAQTAGGLGAGGSGLGGGLFNTPQLGGGGLGTGGLGTGGLKLGTQGGLGGGGGLFNTPLGAGNTSGLFNQQQQQQQQQSGLGGGLFSQQNAGGTTGGLFPPGGLGGLGNTAANGTIKFEAPTGSDTVVRNGTNQNVVTKLQCACAMKQYENHSMEELRWADYQAGRNKGSQGMGTGMGTGTGLGNKLGGGLFNQGQQAGTGGGGLFSQTKLGGGLSTGTGGLFNQQQQQQQVLGGGLFNQQQAGGAGTGLFNQTTGGGLGVNLGTGATGGGLFNQQQQQGTGLGGGLSLFNNAATSGGLGGATGGLFNTQNTIGTGLGQQTTGGLFNTSKANTLGGGLNMGGLGGLGSSLGGGLGLGNKAGGLQLGGGLNTGLKTDGLKGIGQQQPTSLGLGLGLGQSNQPKLGLGLGGGLGTTGLTGGLGTGTGLGTGLGSNLGAGLGGGAKLGIGLGAGAGVLMSTLGTGAQSGGFSDVAALQQQAQLQQQLQVLATSPFGDSPLFRTSLKEAASSTPPSKPELSKAAGKPDFGASSHYKLNMRRGAKLPFKAQSLSSPSRHMDKSLMFEGLDDLETSGGADTFKPRKNIKKLVIQPSSSRPTPTIPDTTVITNEACTTTVTVTPPSSLKTSANKGSPHPASATATVITPPSAGNKSLTTPPSNSSVESPSLVIGNLYSNSVMKPVARHPTSQLDNTMLAFSEPHPSDVEQPSTSSPTPPIIQLAGPSGVLNTRSDYYTIPPVDELDSMATDSDPVEVDNFTIGHHGYGVIVFPGKTDVRDLNLDELVYIGHKEVAVYQDDSCKPPQGEGLNKRAIVTLENTWPLDKTKREPIRDPERLQEMRYAEKVQHSTTKIGARFKEYRPETGSWVFEVDHFSKYKLQENASDDEGDQQQQLQTQQLKQQQQTQQPPPPTRDTTDKTTSKPVTTTAMVIDDSSDDDQMSDGDVEQPLRESPAHEMDAAPPPHSYKLAASMGVSSHKVQVMKASFFTQQAPPTSHPRSPYSPALQSQNLFTGSSNISHRESPVVASSGVTHSPLFKPFTTSTKIQQQQEESPPFSLLSPSVPEPLSSPILSSATVPQGLQPLSQLPELVRDSYFANGQITDLGLAFGRSFTTGWGPHWGFSHFGPPVGNRRVHHQKSSGLLRGLGVQKHIYPTLGPDDVVPFNVTLERLQPSPYLSPEALGNKTLPEMYTPLLAVQLQHSEVGGADVPHVTPIKGNKALLDYAAIPDGLHMSNCSDKFAGQYMKCVWTLAMALWGDLPNEANLPGLDNPSSYGHQLARKDQVTQWLRTVCGQKIDKELSTSSKGSELVYLKSLFGMVSSGHFREACQLARKHRDFRLTLLLSQCGRGSAIARDLLKKQLTVWNKIRADSFVTSERLRVYILLAGFILWETEEQLLSSCEGVEWQRNLAIHLWYCCTPTATIADVLNHYSDSMNDPQVSSHVVQPLPVYRIGQTSDNLTELHDICYHLLQLYCDRSHDLSQLINPATFTPCVLDYRLIWHLFQCLVSLDYTHMSPNMLAHLHTSYAAQLENAGLWQWAVFVALHMDDTKRRTKMVQDILSRHCSSDITLTDHERFVTHQLHVSTELVYEAKALRSRYDGKAEEQVWNLIKAQQWNASHEVIMTQLAARAIVNGHTKTLQKMLSCLAEDDHSNYIMDWDHQGSIVFDFLDITSTMTELQSSNVQQHELGNLATGISNLCRRIPHLPFHSPLEMLCQAEMSKRALNYNKIVSDALQALTGQPSQSNLEYLPTMPLANDDVIVEYRSQANSFITQLNT